MAGLDLSQIAAIVLLCLAVAALAVWLVAKTAPAAPVVPTGGDGAGGGVRTGMGFETAARLADTVRMAALDQAVNGVPWPIWQTDDKGDILWANDEYHRLCGTPPPGATPIDILFPRMPADAGPGKPARAAAEHSLPDAAHWFEIVTVKGGRSNMHYASPADALVRAETAQRNFVQTLTKTFAQLSIGLAIFDRNRQLVLFNPALINLTALPADFLSARPNLLTFFDRMRENRMMPEPKNYSSWREQIAELVVAASDDRYAETWTLPSGLTYRVMGRPHPDGAVAFLLEDISAEISLTRRFRADLELSQSVMDALEDAIAVFSANGVITWTNKAFHQLWNMNPDIALADVTVHDATQIWQEGCKPSDIWPRLRSEVAKLGQRTPWSQMIEMRDGSRLKLSVAPLSGHATLVRFSEHPPFSQAAPETRATTA